MSTPTPTSTAAAAKPTPTPTPDGNSTTPPEVATPEMCQKIFSEYIKKERTGLMAKFYPKGEVPPDLVANAVKMVKTLVTVAKCPAEIAQGMVVLGLYDVVVLIDNSLSMQTQQLSPTGESQRIATLKQVLQFVTNTYSFLRPQGLKAVTYLNTKAWSKDVKPGHIKALFENMYFHGSSRFGTELKRKVLDVYVNKDMPKPLLVIVITDGEVVSEKDGVLVSVIDNCVQELKKQSTDGKGAHAVAFQFASVGDDAKARERLDHLDVDKDVGEYVDTVHLALNPFQDQVLRWDRLRKLLLGAIVSSIDDEEEQEEQTREVAKSEETQDGPVILTEDPDYVPVWE